jgi:Putative prokaryotic signal transducing protein
MQIDPEKERQRLSQLYAGMTRGELEKVAGDAPSLTEEARQSLQEEITRRGLDIVLSEAPPGIDVIEERELVLLRRFRDLPEALMAKGSLEAAGIECFLADDNMIRMDWFISNLLGGIKLLVSPEDLEDANAVLNQPIPESLDVEGVGEYRQPHCPACNSLEVSFEELNKKIAYSSAYLGVPLPIHRKAWRCNVCGHEWQDETREDTKPI